MGLLSGHDHTACCLSMNVGGTRTVIPRGELSRRAPPRSRLARLAHLTRPGPRLCDDFDAATGEVYFDRSATIFAAVAHYLHTGHLHSVSGVCPSAFRAEMAYWGVPCGLLSPCCRPLRSRRREAGHSESSNSESETEIDSGEESDGCWEEDDEQPWIGFEQENESPGSRHTGCSCSHYRQKLWHLLEKPETSFPSRLVSIVSISAVMTSLALLCLQSLPFYRLGSTTINTSKSSIPLPPATLLPVLEGVMMAWFSVEFVLRWLASPDRRRFLWKPLNAIDLACLVPFYVEIGLDQVGSEHEENGHELVTLVQTLRVLRTLKLARHSSGVRQLGSAMHLAAPDVAALGLALAVVVCLFASAAYLLEAETGEGLASIPAGIWWALITMTTVGYGDSYPKTVGGKLVAGACVLSGTLAMALPVTVIFGAFHRQYKTKRKKGED